jgi:hypothetical protein
MTEPAEVTSFQLTLYLGATVNINNGEAWIKPAVSSSITWGGVPTGDQVHDAIHSMDEQILTPTLEEIMDSVIENTKRAKGIGDGTNPYGN